jgi:hypothetical protein
MFNILKKLSISYFRLAALLSRGFEVGAVHSTVQMNAAIK